MIGLRRRIARLTEEASKNEDAWQRSHRREMDLLEADTLGTLLERLTAGLREAIGWLRRPWCLPIPITKFGIC